MRFLKQFIGRAAVADPWFGVWQRRQALRSSTTVLTYHTIGADNEFFDAWTVLRRSDFLRQVTWLRKHYDIVSIDDALRTPAGSRPRVVLSFDDGHSGWVEHLLPIVNAEALPVTLYVATGHIEAATPYWFDRVMNAAQVEGAATIDLTTLGLERWTLGAQAGVDRWLVLSSLLERLKALDERERVMAVASVEQQLQSLPARRVTPLRPLAVSDVKALASCPYVVVGSHTDDHQLLDRVSLVAARRSIEASRQKLELWTGRRVEHFAYPNGNHNDAIVKLVQELGFKSAVTTREGRFVALRDDRHRMARVGVGRFDTMHRFKWGLVRG